MDLHDKDVFLVIGPSRSGKGTLLAALLGHKMKYFNKRNIKGTVLENNVAVANFLAPVADDGATPLLHEIVSHERNSHTMKPKIVGDGHYKDEFKELEGTLLIDFPGIFESKGIELEISMHLAL
jgi:energy-coupling factor transporter ATP-binding protein EcfA2